MDTNALNAKVDAALDRIAARDLQSPQPKLCTFIHPLRQEVVWGPDPKPDTRPMVVAVGAAEGNEAARDGVILKPGEIDARLLCCIEHVMTA